MDNRYSDEKYAEIIRDMKTRLKAKRLEVGEDDTQFPEIAEVVEEYWD